MKKLTKKYANGKVTIDAAMFGVEQTTLDIEIFNNEAITAAVAKLHKYEKQMTYDEKIEAIKKFRTEADGALDMLLLAYEKEDTDEILKFSNELKEACSPVVEMYTNGLNRAINPTHISTVPIVIMILKHAMDGIIKHNPGTEKLADIFDKLFPSEVWEINIGR